MGKIYSFTQNQLKVLLSGMGYSEISGIALADTVLENRTVLNTLNELTNMKFIFTNGSSFILNGEVKQIISRIGCASGYIAIHSSNQYIPDKCCFNGDRILICCSRNNSKNYISAYFADSDELYKNLCDEGYFPENTIDFSICEDELIEYEKEIFDEIVPQNTNKLNSSVLFSAEIISKEGILQKYMRIIDYYFYNYIAEFDGDKVIRELYSRQAAEFHFERLMSNK